jgi:hypothetical protein
MFAMSTIVALAVACGSAGEGDTTATADQDASASGADGNPIGFELNDPDASDAPVVIVDGGALGTCQVGTTQCTNCVDDDNDGLPDWLDPDCTGPLDNDESSFATGIPGDNVDPCRQDCFFDGNSGSGDDKCLWDLKCDPKSPGAPKCPYSPTAKCAPQTKACVDFCKPLTPNGCDCFGCCTLPTGDGGSVDVLLVSTCSAAKAGDANACPRCTKDPSCNNPCERCELCVGKNELPADCKPANGGDGGTTSPADGGTGQVCPYNRQSCDATTLCPVGSYCLTGCCVPQIR